MVKVLIHTTILEKKPLLKKWEILLHLKTLNSFLLLEIISTAVELKMNMITDSKKPLKMFSLPILYKICHSMLFVETTTIMETVPDKLHMLNTLLDGTSQITIILSLNQLVAKLPNLL